MTDFSYPRPHGAAPAYYASWSLADRIAALPRYAVEYAPTDEPDVERVAGFGPAARGGYVRLADVLAILRPAPRDTSLPVAPGATESK
jgi:hypothetical protein